MSARTGAVLIFSVSVYNFYICSGCLPSQAFHCTTLDVIYDVMMAGWQPSTLQPTGYAGPRISLIVPESSLAKDQPDNFDNPIKSSISMAFLKD